MTDDELKQLATAPTLFNVKLNMERIYDSVFPCIAHGISPGKTYPVKAHVNGFVYVLGDNGEVSGWVIKRFEVSFRSYWRRL